MQKKRKLSYTEYLSSVFISDEEAISCFASDVVNHGREEINATNKRSTISFGR